jgi:hypothetical protein
VVDGRTPHPDPVISPDPIASEGYVMVNGVSHFFRSTGYGEPFIVLHGGPGMWHDELLPFFDDLARDHQVVFYDQRGNGKSLMPEITNENFTVDWLVSDLEELAERGGSTRSASSDIPGEGCWGCTTRANTATGSTVWSSSILPRPTRTC